MNKEKKIYLVFNEDDNDSQFWEQYESLVDAVSSHGDGVEVYTAQPKRLGCFKRKASLVRIKQKKSSKK